MNKKQIGGLVLAVLLFILTGVTSVVTNTTTKNSVSEAVGNILAGGYEFNAPKSKYVAVVKVEGVIQQQVATGAFAVAEGYQHTTTMEYIDDLMQDKNNAGIVLYVDSPGGAVYESDELYRKLEEYKKTTKRDVWSYMAHYAASGGYYVAAATEKIYANPNTTTGSIGVIMSGYDMTGLYEKLGIEYVSITSGKNKDSSQLTDEQIAIYQSQVDEAYEGFVGIVAEGRNLAKEEVVALADGRTYTAKQALEKKLIDNIASYETMKREMSDKVGTNTFYELAEPTSMWGSMFAKLEQLIPQSEAQVLSQLADNKKSGELMYYAEQMQ